MTDTDIAPAGSTDLSPADEAALAAASVGAVDASDIVIPQLKLLQGQSKEVEAGIGEPGEFINSLVGQPLGEEIDFVVASSFKGRFWSDEDSRGHGTGEVGPADAIPWTQHPEYGVPFGEAKDAEEVYRESVQAGEFEWGRGPGISTTINFVGFVAGGDEGLAVPVRLSLMRAATPAGRTLLTFITRLSRTPWDAVYQLKSTRQTKGRYTYFTPEVTRKRDTSPEERQEAVRLAQVLQGERVKFEEAPADPTESKPTPKPREGAIEV